MAPPSNFKFRIWNCRTILKMTLWHLTCHLLLLQICSCVGLQHLEHTNNNKIIYSEEHTEKWSLRSGEHKTHSSLFSIPFETHHDKPHRGYDYAYKASGYSHGNTNMKSTKTVKNAALIHGKEKLSHNSGVGELEKVLSPILKQREEETLEKAPDNVNKQTKGNHHLRRNLMQTPEIGNTISPTGVVVGRSKTQEIGSTISPTGVVVGRSKPPKRVTNGHLYHKILRYKSDNDVLRQPTQPSVRKGGDDQDMRATHTNFNIDVLNTEGVLKSFPSPGLESYAGGNRRSVRSTNRISFSNRTQNDILPVNCTLSPSCTDRLAEEIDESAVVRYPCRCDEDCETYGDCCYDFKDMRQAHSADDHPRRNGMPRTHTVQKDTLTCRLLVPEANRHYMQPRAVYMVSACPRSTPKPLADKCIKNSGARSSQRYLMDIPVVSANSGIVYANIFCAQCHRDLKFKEHVVDVMCSDNVTSKQVLSTMTYHPGELTWSAKRQNGQMNDDGNVWCTLDVQYDDDVGRSCNHNLIETCGEDWSDDDVRKKCLAYNYYAEVGSKRYKNWHCALCNKEQQRQIKCLYPFSNYGRGSMLDAPTPSLSDIFKSEENCVENQIWNYLYDRCEDVSCGYLFTLVNGECVRNNYTVERDGRSYLNSSCYTHDFQREYSVLFPNNSVYLNHTKKVYNIGEYEFTNHTWIRVCRPEDRWTPVMNIISTFLISISLVCMALHMATFILLPKRRNIPSTNLFCMTLSLFISEMVFVIFFYANETYGVCVFIGIVIYYFFTASFMWMNVMSLDICRTFHSKTYKVKSRKIFIQYSIYAWSVPMISTFTALMVDQFASSDFILRPEFGTDRCWFNNKWGLVTFFTVPSALLLLFNLVLFGVSVYDIYKQHKSGELASSTIRKGKPKGEKETFLKSSHAPRSDTKSENSVVNNKNDNDQDSPRCTERIKDKIQRRIQANKKQRMRLVLYSKLAVIMGMTWIFAFISMHTESRVFEYLFIIFNGLQGTFIFLAFDCKKKQWDELWMRLTGKRIFRPGTKSSSNTGDTALTSSSSSGRYKYRRSSKSNNDGSMKASSEPKNEQSL